MAVVIVGGQSRKVGKTSVVAGLIAALPELRWTAIKLTQHEHSANLAGLETAILIHEEHDRDSGTDSSRYLAAGAERAFWIRVRPGHLGAQMPRLHDVIAGAQNTILESNSILEFLEPDLALCVLDPSVADVKPSALRFLESADALVIPEGAHISAPRSGIPQTLRQGKHCFSFRPPQSCSGELIAFVAGRLSARRV